MTTRCRTARVGAAIVATALCGGILSACGSGGSGGSSASGGSGGSGGSGESVTIAKTSQNGLQLILIDIADQRGFFSKHGVNAKVVALNGDAGSIPALTSGSVQFAVSTSTPYFAAAKKTDALEIVAPLSAEPPEQIVVSKSTAQKLGITSQMPVKDRLRALKGQHIAVKDVGGGLQYTLTAALGSVGIQPNDAEVSAVSPYSAMLAALRAGQIDAAAPAVPYGYQAVAQGDAQMLADIWNGDVPSIQNLYFELLDVNRDYAKSHPQTVAGVKAALKDAMGYIKSNPDGALQVAKKLLPNFSDDVLKPAITGKSQFPTTTTITQQDFDKLAAFAKTSGVDPSGVTFEKSIWKQ